MSMNLSFLCCIGAELKNSTQQTTRMTQVYLYRAFENQTITEMLSAGFFNEALGILRKDDLLLLYSPNETKPRWIYTRVSDVNRDGVEIETININATEISVDTTGYSNISGDNLQEIINSIDSEFSKYVKLDGTSIMTGPLKMRSSVSFKCAIAPSWDGVGFYKLNDNDSLTLMASMETTDGLCPATNNTYNIGKASHKWKDAHIARVITAILNNGYDIAVPITNSPDTLALKSQVDAAANSGDQLYTTGVWYAKMYAGTTPPSSAEVEGRNYADFSQVDGNGDPIIVVYTYTSGAWAQTATITPPADYNGYMTITSKIWDISEQTGQQGGKVLWSHNQKTFTPYPQIILFEDAALTGTPTAPLPTNASPNNQVATKEYVDNTFAQNAANTDLSNLTDQGKNISNWSSNVSNCITEIPQDIKLELNNGTLTLKAGSKAYIPNGSGVFDTVTTQTDLTIPLSGTYSYFVFVKDDGFGGYTGTTSSCFSGATQPSVSVQYAYWYDTTNNVIKYTSDTGSTWIPLTCSLPVAIVTVTSGVITSINQVFNGFGYIGSTGFVLPGVKGLVPNGKNADGTCKNISFTISNVLTVTRTWTAYQTQTLWYNVEPINGEYLWFYNNYYERTTPPSDVSFSMWYNPDTNILKYNDGNTDNGWTEVKSIKLFTCGANGTTAIDGITNVKNTFQIIDYSGADVVIDFQTPTSSNNYTWYRKYKSGWVEQGGKITPPSGNSTQNVTFPIPMADTNYFITGSLTTSSDAAAWESHSGTAFYNKTTTGFSKHATGTFSPYLWRVEGMAA